VIPSDGALAFRENGLAAGDPVTAGPAGTGSSDTRPDVTRSSDAGWTVTEGAFDPARIHASETVFVIGNGVLGTRGTFEEGFSGDWRATLVHGIFDDSQRYLTELACVPDWTALEITLAGERFTLEAGATLVYGRVLDVRNGLLSRSVRWQSPRGLTWDLAFERFASLADTHLLFGRVTVTAVDGGGPVQVRSLVDPLPLTDGVNHWRAQEATAEAGVAAVLVETLGSHLQVGLAQRLTGSEPAVSISSAVDVSGRPALSATWTARAGQAVAVTKAAALHTSRENSAPLAVARAGLEATAPDWDSVLAASAANWADRWAVCDVVIEGDDEAQLAVRYSIFQLLISAPCDDDHVSIAAKTLSGLGYRGHVFWDTEAFMLPFFTFVQPELARNLLSYRWHLLDAARRIAAAGGFKGARYPWESAMTGEEVTPPFLPDRNNPSKLIRIWTRDTAVHVGADVSFAVYQYWRVSGDDLFMAERGAEVLFETARFYASRAEWNAVAGRYEYTTVTGPDEYHEHVSNNAFTNYLAAWNLRAAAEVAEWLRSSDLRGKAAGEPAADEVAAWRDVAAKIYLPRDPRTGLVEQSDGFFGLRDVNLADYRGRSKSMQALLGLEDVPRTQILKQPDVLMLAFMMPDLFGPEELARLDAYYTPRTDLEYGSSLGPGIQAILSCQVGDAGAAYGQFIRAARADLRDVRGNAGDGIHGASAGATWQAIVFGFAGLRVDHDGWLLRPRLPEPWTRIAFRFSYRGEYKQVDIRRLPGVGSGVRAESSA